jgi:hypothetical protein
MTAHSATPPRGSSEEEEEGAPFLLPTGSVASLPGLQKKADKPWVLLVALACVLIAIVDMGAFMAEAPRTRVYEANICLSHYREHDPTAIGSDGTVPEKLCKIDVVQQRMATIFGWQDMFDAIPSIFLAIPFGTLADKVGRKWIFTASLVGLQLNGAWVLMICEYGGTANSNYAHVYQVTSRACRCSSHGCRPHSTSSGEGPLSHQP